VCDPTCIESFDTRQRKLECSGLGIVAYATTNATSAYVKDALIYSTHPAWRPESPQGVLRGTGQTGRLFKPRGAGCGPCGRHPVI